MKPILLTALLLSLACTGLTSPETAAKQEERVDLYIFTTRLLGYEIRSVARADGVCPAGCDSTIRVQVPSRGIDDTYQARTTVLSTALTEIELVEP